MPNLSKPTSNSMGLCCWFGIKSTYLASAVYDSSISASCVEQAAQRRNSRYSHCMMYTIIGVSLETENHTIYAVGART